MLLFACFFIFEVKGNFSLAYSCKSTLLIMKIVIYYKLSNMFPFCSKILNKKVEHWWRELNERRFRSRCPTRMVEQRDLRYEFGVSRQKGHKKIYVTNFLSRHLYRV